MININRLMEYCDNDAELAMQFLEMFRGKASAAISEMPGLAANGDWKALSNSAHKMKSQCRYVGAVSLADLAANIEFACDQHQVDKVAVMVEQFKTGMCDLLETF